MTRKRCGVVLLACLQGVALAQDQWLNLQDQYWTVSLNWLDNSSPTSGEVVVFNSLASAAATDLGTNFTVQSVAVTDVGVPVSVSNFTLTVLDGGVDLSAAAQDLEVASFLNVATAQTWNVQAGRTLTVGGRVTGNGVPTKQGAGALVMRGNDLRTVGTTLAAGETVISGGVFNSTVTLAAGATLIARSGPGLVGEFYSVAPASNNFDTLAKMEAHLATLNPVVLHNFPGVGGSFDFGSGAAGTNFPPGVPTQNFEARWRGTFLAAAAGTYTFQTASDDGSMLWIDGTNVVFNNYFQGIALRGGTIGLDAGVHTIEMAFYQGSGDKGLYANFATPGGPTNRITLADVATGPALRMLAADPASFITVDETLLTLAPTSTLTIATPIGGSGGLRKIGTAGLVLSATNSFAGGLYLYGGTVTVAQAESLGAATSGLDLRAGTLRFTGTTPATLDDRALNEDSVAAAFDLANAGHTLTVTSLLRGASVLTKLGPGALVLAGVNDLTTTVTVAAGTLRLAGSAALPLATNLVVNGTLALDQGNSLSDAAVVRLGGLAGGRIVISNAAAEAVDRFYVDGVLQASGTWGATGSGAAHVNDTWFGGDGILAVAVGYDAGAASGSWSTNANGNWSDTNNWVGQVYAQGTNNTAYFTNALTADRTATQDITPALPLGGLVFGSPTNSWTVGGSTIELAVNAGAPTVTVATNTATLSASLSGTQGLGKAGGGVLNLTSSSNRYSGTTTVDAGTLLLTGAGSLYSGGASSGAIVVNNGGTLTFGKTDVWGIHTSVPLPGITIQAGGLMQNSGAVFSTLGPVALAGGELRLAGGGNKDYQAFHIRGTVPVTGAVPSRITATKTVNGNVQIQVGNNTPGGATTLEVADVTGNADADLLVSAGFADSHAVTGTFGTVASGIVKKGPGTVLASGNSLNTGANQLDLGSLVVSGGVFNGAVVLSNGTTLVALPGEGLLGEYYYLGANPNYANFNTLEGFGDHLSGLTPNLLFNGPATGTNFDFGAAGGNFPPPAPIVNFEVRYTGQFVAPAAGVYSFLPSSDDGSMIWIDGTNIVNNNGGHAIQARTGTVAIASGPHDIVVAFGQGTGGYGFYVDVAHPGGVTNRLALNALRTGPAVAGLTGEAGSAVAISNTTLSVVITNTATFGGTLSGPGMVRKLGLGSWTLAGINTHTGNIISAGRLVHNGDVHLGGPGAAITFDGGTLEVQDPGVFDLNSHPVNWATFNGGLDIVPPMNTFTITNPIGTASAYGSFAKYGAGDLVLTREVFQNRGWFRGGDTWLSSNALSDFQFYVSVGLGAAERASLSVGGSGTLVSSNDLNVGDTSGSTGVLFETGSALIRARTLFVGKNGNAAGALHLQGGGLQMHSAAAGDWRVGGAGTTNDALAYGYLRQTSGNVLNDRNVQFGAFGRGVYALSGGTWTQANAAPVMGRYPGSRGLFLAQGGGFEQTAGAAGTIVGEQGHGVLEVDSAARLVLRTGLRVGGVNANVGTGVVNLAGGALETTLVGTGPAGSFGTFNFDGGTLRALANNPTFMQGLVAAYVWPGGAVVDAGSYGITIAQNLLTPPGSGVSGLVLTNGGSGYIGPPLVVIEGGGGTGATAVAEVDLVAGVVTNVRVTCPGVDYTTAPAVTLVGGGGTGAGVGLPSLAANAGGGLVKLGSGALKLTGTNTFAGNIVISNGVFLVGSTNLTGGLELAGTNIGIGGAFNIDQSFLTWLAGKMVGSNPAALAIGANTTNDLDLSAAPWANGAIVSGGGTESFSGGLTTGGTNLYLGGTAGTLVWARVIGTGTNVFIGRTGGETGGVVTLSGTNAGYGSEINVLGGTLRVGLSNALGGAAARVIVASGAALDVNASYAGNLSAYVAGTGLGGAGAIVNSAGNAIPALRTVRLYGDTTFGGPGRWDIRGATTGPVLDLAGFTVVKTNNGELGLYNCEITDGNLVIGQGLVRLEQGTSATAGVGRITVGASGTLDLYNMTGPCTRPISITGGYLRVGAGTVVAGSAITLTHPGTNTFEPYPNTTLVLTGVVDGVGMLRKLNTGVLRLQSTSGYAGDTLVNGGVLSLEVSNALAGTIGSSSGLFIYNGGVVRVSTNDALFGTNARPVTVYAGGVLTCSNGAAPLYGPLTLAGGTLDGAPTATTRGNWLLGHTVGVVSNSALLAPRVQLGVATGTVFDVAASRTLVSGSTLEDPELGAAGTGTLVKVGAGTLLVAASNTFAGATRVEQGTLRLVGAGSATTLPGLLYWLDAADTNTLTVVSNQVAQWSDKSGNARHFVQTNSTLRPLVNNTGLSDRATLVFDGSDDQVGLGTATSPRTVFLVNRPTQYTTLNGVWGSSNPGDKGIRQASATAWSTPGDGNDFHNPQGRIFVNGTAGASFGALGTPHVLAEYRGTAHATTYNNTLVGGYFPARYFKGDVAEVLAFDRELAAEERAAVEAYLRNKWLGVALTSRQLLPAATALRVAAGATVDLNGNNQSVGSLGDGSTAGGLVENSASNALTLTIGLDNTTASFGGVLRNGVGTVALVKTGLGEQALHGSNTYAGGTTVLTGSLQVNGSIGTGVVAVLAGGTLGGTGLVAGPVLNSGFVAPGASAGILQLGSTFDQSSGLLLIELAGTTPGAGYDRLAVAGAATLGGALVVSTNGGFLPAPSNTFTILTAASITGAFASTNLPALDPGLGWEVQYTATAVSLVVTGAAGASPTPYETWAQSIPNPAERGEQADPDGDGYANLLEYSQGTDATNSADNAKLALVRTNGQFLVLFNRVNSATDIVYEVEGAYLPTNNALWLGIATNVIGSWGSSTNVNDNNTAAVHRVLVTDLEIGTNRSLRLKVTRP